MGKDHLKRLAAPKKWQIVRKKRKFITKPASGPHGLGSGIPLGVLLKEVFGYANTTREAKKILNLGGIKIDCTTRKDFRFPVGFFDTIEFTDINEHFRVMLDKKGKLILVKINKDEAVVKPCKITGKTMVGGRMQLNLYDGKNLLVDNGAYKVGDTLILSLPEQKIAKHLKLEKKSVIFLIGGRHIGETGSIEDITQNKITYKDQGGNLIETSKKYAFVIGSEKPMITVE